MINLTRKIYIIFVFKEEKCEVKSVRYGPIFPFYIHTSRADTNESVGFFISHLTMGCDV